MGIHIWMQDRKINMGALKWILTVGWLIFVGFAITFAGTCIGENELHAAKMSSIVFGSIAIVTGVILWRILQIERKPEDI